MLIDPELGSGIPDVTQDCRAVGDGLGFAPRLEVVAKRVHVRIGTYARVAKQVPGAAHRLARLEDDEALAGALALQMAGSADAGQAGTDDDDIKCFVAHCPYSRVPPTRVFGSRRAPYR